MIVSHRHKFIFLAVPRTGTHAVREALAPFLGEADWQQEALIRGVYSPVPMLARLGHGHVSAREAQAHLPGCVWRSYFKFAVVRDPYDRFVSVCAMLNKRNGGYAGNETAFMKRALGVPRFRARVLVRPQAQLLMDEAGKIAVDFVGRLESLQSSFREACRRIGLPCVPLRPVNATDHAPYGAYYDDELAGLVTRFYHEDFAAFGFRRASSAAELPAAAVVSNLPSANVQ